MRKQSRLRHLQVRVPRHNRVQMGFGQVDEDSSSRPEQPDEVVRLFAQPQPKTGRHLVVAAARGVQFATDRADALRQRVFDVHVNVFQLDFPLEVARLDVGANIIQTTDDCLDILR